MRARAAARAAWKDHPQRPAPAAGGRPRAQRPGGLIAGRRRPSRATPRARRGRPPALDLSPDSQPAERVQQAHSDVGRA